MWVAKEERSFVGQSSLGEMGERRCPVTATFETVNETNLEELRRLNRVIFPINYPDKVYQDIIACGEISQLARWGGDVIGAVSGRLEQRGEKVGFEYVVVPAFLREIAC